MAITSVFLLIEPMTENINDRKLVVEKHTNTLTNQVRLKHYEAVAGETQAKMDQIMADRAADIMDNLKLTDIAEALYGSDPNYVWENATNTDISDVARSDYKDLPPEANPKRAKLAKRILEWIAINRFGANTDNAIRNKFGVTTPNWITLKVKMQNLVDSQETVETTVGE